MPPRPQRFFSLDVLRGLAALTVVFWHWQHFLLVGSRAGGGAPLTRPLGRTFELFYSVGWIAVDLFFALSGFIFFWLYAEAITERRVSREGAILTLVLVETRRGTFGRRLSFIGDLSYSSYLLHFPLQVAVAILVVVVSADRAILFSRAFFVWFFAVLILASLASYHWFEAPAQRWIRTRLIRRGAGARVAVATTRASGSGDSSGASRAGSP